MAGSGDTGGDSNNGSSRGAGINWNVNGKLTQALLAIILGGGGAAGYLNMNPPRPDPWTGTQAREEHASIRAELRELELHCEQHNSKPSHREQSQLNREIFWRLEKLEKPGSDSK